MPVEGRLDRGRGTVAPVVSSVGVITPGDAVELVGIRDTRLTTVTGVEMRPRVG